MDRIIKFRAQDENFCWHFGNYDQDNQEIFYTHIDADGCHKVNIPIVPATVGEFVAMDSSDNPIYENDIVAANYSHYGKYENFVVKKHHLDWFLFYNDLPVERLWWFLKYRKVIVVGNIFDNPELLEVEK